MQSLRDMLDLDLEISTRRKQNPLNFFVPLLGQDEFLDDKTNIKVVYGGNRAGKTMIGAVDVLRTAIDNKNQKIWCSAVSFSDSVAIQQEKIWKLIPKHHIEYGKYSEILGFANRKLLLKNGSLITFKCLTRGSLVQMGDGTWRDISHIDIGDFVKIPSGKNKEVLNKFKYQPTKIFDIKTKKHNISCTPEHKFLLKNGEWKEAKDITVGDIIKSVSYCGVEKTAKWKPKILALLITEGCLITKRSIRFTTFSPDVLIAIHEILPVDFKIKKTNNHPGDYAIMSDNYVGNRIKQFLIQSNLWNKKASEKHIPDFVLKWGKKQQKEFIEMMFACDGRVTRSEAVYTTSSKKMAEQINKLLWNFNVHPHLRHVNDKHYRVECYGIERKNFDVFKVIGKNIKYNVNHIKQKGHIDPGTVISKYAGDRKKEVFCIEIKDTHEFIVNGLVTHNSFDQGRELFQGAGVH